MKKMISLLLAFILLCSCMNQKMQNEYKPKCQQDYIRIYHFIEDNWEQYYVKQLHHDDYVLPYPGISYDTNTLKQFYWDTYFVNEGLIKQKNRGFMAKSNIDNLLWEVDTMGFVPNCNFSWGRNRSQPPYLSMMVRRYYENVEKNEEWLSKAFYTLKKEYKFWMDSSVNAIEKNTTPLEGMVRYYHHASADEVVELYNELAQRLGFDKDISRDKKIEIAGPYVAEAETGMDWTPRFEGRCPDFIAVDLNSNLYLYEKNFAWMVQELGLDDETDWNARAEFRKKQINKYCWNEKRGLYLDYDYVNKRHSKVAAVTGFSPLFAGIASTEQAARVVRNISLFETDYGLVVVEKDNQERSSYMWGNDDLWAPMQYIAFEGLRNYGYKDIASRIGYKWMDLVARNFSDPVPRSGVTGQGYSVQHSPGHIYEKYSSKSGGSINIDEYPSNAIICWSAGVFVHFFTLLNGEMDGAEKQSGK